MTSQLIEPKAETTNGDEKVECVVKPSKFRYFQELEKFQQFSNTAAFSNSKIESKDNDDGTPSGLSLDTISLCCKLSQWIYTPKNCEINGLNNKNFEIIKLSEAKDKKYVQWSLLKTNKNDKILYLVFRGTDSVMDIISDIGVLPVPVCFGSNNRIRKKNKTNINDSVKYNTSSNDKNDDQDEKKEENTGITSNAVDDEMDKIAEISVHSGIHCNLIREFDSIWKEIKQYINKNELQFDKLYITGHSLGGGMSIIFGLLSMIKSLIPNIVPYNKVKIIGIAAPTVIAIENKNKALSLENEKYLNDLSSITHCIVNRFDIVPRVPFSVSWLKNMAPKVLAFSGNNTFANIFNSGNMLRDSIAVLGLLIAIYKDGHKTASQKMFDGLISFEKKIDHVTPILQLYRPVGNYYIFFSDSTSRIQKEKYIFTNKVDIIQSILSYTPKYSFAASTIKAAFTNCKESNKDNYDTCTSCKDSSIRNDKNNYDDNSINDKHSSCGIDINDERLGLSWMEFLTCFNFYQMLENHGIKQYCQLFDNINTSEDMDEESISYNGNYNICGYSKNIENELSKFKQKQFECGSGRMFWNTIERKILTMERCIELQVYCNPNKATKAVLSTIRKYAWWSDGTQNARIVLKEFKLPSNSSQIEWSSLTYKNWQVASSDDLQSLKDQMKKY